MPGAGEVAGITMGAEFEVYQDQNFRHPLGTVVAFEVGPDSTTLYAKEFKIALEGDGVALKSRAGKEEQVRIHVADSDGILENLVKQIDPHQIITQLVERDRADFGMALEDGKVVFDIYDTDVTKYGLDRMPYKREPTVESMSPVIRAAAHFFYHRRRTLQTGRRGLARNVEIEVIEMKFENNDDGESRAVYGHGDWTSGKELHLRTGPAIYGWRIVNKCDAPLYPALFYFDNSDWSISEHLH